MALPSSSPAARGRDEYTGFYLIVIVVGLILLGWLLWSNYHTELSAAAMTGAHWQMQVIHLSNDRFEAADAQVLAANPAHVTFPRLVHLFREIGQFFMIPAIAFVLVLAALSFRLSAAMRFTGALDLDGLIAEQAKAFRSTAAFVGRRLGLVDIRSGEPRPGDSALNLNEWLAAFADGPHGFDEGHARGELARQLGEPWRGVKEAAPHVRCLIAVFGLHMAKKRRESLAFLGGLAEALARPEKESRSGPETPLSFPPRCVALADAWLRKSEVIDPVAATMNRHFFTTPALMSALTEARRRAGVLAPAQFAFLKLVDRRLWYALHSLGFESDGPRRHPHPCQRVEAIGARDHWAAERLAGRPIGFASVDRAIGAIKAAAAQGSLKKRPTLALPAKPAAGAPTPRSQEKKQDLAEKQDASPPAVSHSRGARPS